MPSDDDSNQTFTDAIVQLVADTEKAMRTNTATRTVARSSIAAAIEGLVELLKRLPGPLRGAPNLTDGEQPFHGWVVRAKNRKDRIQYPKTPGTTSSLVLQPSGDLAIVDVTFKEWFGGSTESAPAPDYTIAVASRSATGADYLPTDLRDLIDTVGHALQRHLSSTTRSTEQWKAASSFAERVRKLLLDEE